MGIGGYSTVDALRGEMGASLVSSRVMETMMLYVIDTMRSNFDNMKEMMKDTIRVKKGRWYTSIDKHRENLGITWEELQEMSREELKSRVRIYDTERWQESLEAKSSQKYYLQGKREFGYEFCYRNNFDSMFLARARLNALKLEEQISRGKPNYDATCKLCKSAKEDMAHFLIDCEELEEDRDYNLIDNSTKNSEDRMVDLLFKTQDFQGVGHMIRKMWQRRRKLLTYMKEQEDRKKKAKKTKPHSPVVYQKSDPGPVRRGHDCPEGRSLRGIRIRG